MYSLNTAVIDNAINNAKGRFLTITFIKKDGTTRTINGRTGVKRYLKGGKATVSAKEYIILYSIHDKGYRSINKSTITRISSSNAIITFA